MAASISLTETQIIAALRAWILVILPAGVECVRGQRNRVPEPTSPNFVEMTPILRERLSTNTTCFSDGPVLTPATSVSTRTDTGAMQLTIQLDIHGPSSGDNTQVITTLFRSEQACSFFAATGNAMAPLYHSDPRQMPFTDGEQQVEDRWSIDVMLQANIGVTTPQDFAGTVAAGVGKGNA
jgi:hypothetical protein